MEFVDGRTKACDEMRCCRNEAIEHARVRVSQVPPVAYGDFLDGDVRDEKATWSEINSGSVRTV